MWDIKQIFMKKGKQGEAGDNMDPSGILNSLPY